MVDLRANPFFLDDEGVAWVKNTIAGMTLEEVLAVMKDGEEKGLKVVRVHTGDPAIFGAHREQMDALERMGIEYEVIPGVSSFLATAAVLKKEYTLPGVSQTVILTRMEGRTPMPEGEKLRDLAKLLDMGVTWEESSATIGINTAKSYQ